MANVQVTDGAGNLILDGDTTPSTDNQTSFGSVNVGSSLARTYTLENEGARSLGVAGVTIGGANAADFSVTQQPASSLGKNSTSNFVVTFRPTATGARNATVTITTSGAAKNTFTFDITGNGTSAAASATDAALSSLV